MYGYSSPANSVPSYHNMWYIELFGIGLFHNLPQSKEPQHNTHVCPTFSAVYVYSEWLAVPFCKYFKYIPLLLFGHGMFTRWMHCACFNHPIQKGLSCFVVFSLWHGTSFRFPFYVVHTLYVYVLFCLILFYNRNRKANIMSIYTQLPVFAGHNYTIIKYIMTTLDGSNAIKKFVVMG